MFTSPRAWMYFEEAINITLSFGKWVSPAEGIQTCLHQAFLLKQVFLLWLVYGSGETLDVTGAVEMSFHSQWRWDDDLHSSIYETSYCLGVLLPSSIPLKALSPLKTAVMSGISLGEKKAKRSSGQNSHEHLMISQQLTNWLLLFEETTRLPSSKTFPQTLVKVCRK